MTYKKPRKPGDMGYHRGALVALAALHKWDGAGGVAYREVMMMFDLDELLHVARREGQIRSAKLLLDASGSPVLPKSFQRKLILTAKELKCAADKGIRV